MRRLVEYLQDATLPEAPDLGTPNAALRSYDGDALGRGAGVYDRTHRIFYPYARRAEWAEMAADATEFRRALYRDGRYAAAPPAASDVAVEHVAREFADGADGAPACLLDDEEAWGRAWIVAAAEPPPTFRRLADPELAAAVAAHEHDYRDLVPYVLCAGVTRECCVRVHGATFVPLRTPARAGAEAAIGARGRIRRRRLAARPARRVRLPAHARAVRRPGGGERRPHVRARRDPSGAARDSPEPADARAPRRRRRASARSCAVTVPLVKVPHRGGEGGGGGVAHVVEG